jgi:hypothetical protein
MEPYGEIRSSTFSVELKRPMLLVHQLDQAGGHVISSLGAIEPVLMEEETCSAKLAFLKIVRKLHVNFDYGLPVF